MMPAAPLPFIALPLLLLPIHQPTHSSALNSVSGSLRHHALHAAGSGEMGTPKHSKGSKPFKDLTNTSIPNSFTNNNVEGSTIPSQLIDSQERKRQRDRKRYAEMPVQRQEELLKRRREARWQKKDAIINDQEGEIANNNENVDPQEDHDWLQGKNNTPLQERQGLRSEQIESRRAKDRARYANMTPEQRQAIRDRQNARIRKPNQKQAKDYDRVRRALRHNTLHKNSIAMINPLYNPMEDSP
ncbi:hypothetical protein BS78_K135700 [Paspalum vaginatum]|uniref:Uncharacterized protein n=1 Tax=Paspalum vaginatum TaxID=158149 RepID=A0A9W7XC18_9POAL|nr:hypothetical protein BS78_K135700 [Paspalum vaginatum]